MEYAESILDLIGDTPLVRLTLVPRDLAPADDTQPLAQGERPLYRVRTARYGRWSVEDCPWPVVDPGSRREALVAARAA